MGLERTLILCKPDAVQRRLVGEIYSRFERRGLKIVGLKLLQVTSELARKHYAEHVEKPFFPDLESFITAGPVVAIVAEVVVVLFVFVSVLFIIVEIVVEVVVAVVRVVVGVVAVAGAVAGAVCVRFEFPLSFLFHR